MTDRDLREHHGHLCDTRVTAAVVERPFVVRPDDSIEMAVDVMLAQKIRALPVVDDGRPIGMLTDTDLLRGLFGRLPTDQDPRAYVDVRLTAPTQILSHVVSVLESSGWTVLGVRTIDDPCEVRTFRLYLDDGDAARAADVLREHGFAVRAVHQEQASSNSAVEK